jgi:hypothetical protein
MRHFLFGIQKAALLAALCLLIWVDVLHGQTIQIGASGAPPASQATIYNGIPSPVFSAKTNARVQLFYTASELTALGMSGAQIIDSFSFYAFTLPAGALQNYTVKMKGSSDNFDDYDKAMGFSNVYANTSQTIVAGWNKFPLQHPFYWNGTDNLAIDFCWTNNSVAPYTGGLWADITGNHENLTWFISDTIAACGNYPAQEGYYDIYRPVLRIGYHTPTSCSTPLTFSISPSGTVSVPKGCTQKLEATGITPATGLTYQWEVSTNGGSSWSNAATSAVYEFYPQVNAQYRLTMSCSGNSYTSNVTTINTTQPAYASLPYFQDFENWTNGCLGLKELPDVHWVNSPNLGSSSWRRDDQGMEAGWKDYIYYNFVMLNYGVYSPSSVSGNHSARFHSHTTSPDLMDQRPGNLDLYLDCSAGPAGKALYFYYYDSTINTMANSIFAPMLFTTEDSLMVSLSTDNGANFSTLATFTEAVGPGWHRAHIPFNSTSATTVLRLHAARTVTALSYFSDIGIDSVYVAASCNGTPYAGTILNNQLSSCSASTKNLTATGTSLAGGLHYQWQQSSDNITWASVTGGSGDTTLSYITPNLTDTTYYRLIVTCQNSGLSDTTNVATVYVPSPIYATIPYTEGFENWADYCETKDRPAPYWFNTPATGSFAWRRDDEGKTANWGIGSGPDAYNYNYDYSFNQNYHSLTHTNPPAIEGDHFARNHAGYESFDALLWSFLGSGPFPNYGKMDLYIDCSGAGQKELNFFYNNQGTAMGAPIDDSLYVYLSTDGGNTFTTLWSAADTNTLWNYISVPFTSTAANTIIRFKALNDFDDATIGVDKLQVVSACTGQPNAGIVDSTIINYACANDTFYVRLAGTSLAGGLTYEWQTSSNGTSWSSVANSNTPVLATSMNADTWYRCIVRCTASGLADTTPARLITLAPFYYCYCASAADNSVQSQVNIGNAMIVDTLMQDTVLDNGMAYPSTLNQGPYNFYSDHRKVAATPIAQGSVYRLDLTFIATNDGTISSGPTGPVTTAYIDYNGNGIYEPTEQLFLTSLPMSQSMITYGVPISNFFTVPANAATGITGMRVIVDAYSGGANVPCGYFATGETEDYLVFIDNPKCNGAPSAGVAYITDTLVSTVGSTVIVYDTAHTKDLSQLTWIWQSSNDGVNWTDVAGSEMQDSITATITTLTYFRLMITCATSQDTAYSNHVSSVPLSVQTLSANEGRVRVFPNPTDGKVQLSFQGNPQETLVISVTDITGRILLQKHFGRIFNGFSTTIDLHQYSSGVYFIKCDFEKGSLVNKVIVR